MECTNNRMYSALKKEGKFCNMDKPERHYAKGSKPDTKGHLLSDST